MSTFDPQDRFQKMYGTENENSLGDQSGHGQALLQRKTSWERDSN